MKSRGGKLLKSTSTNGETNKGQFFFVVLPVLSWQFRPKSNLCTHHGDLRSMRISSLCPMSADNQVISRLSTGKGRSHRPCLSAAGFNATKTRRRPAYSDNAKQGPIGRNLHVSLSTNEYPVFENMCNMLTPAYFHPFYASR